MKLHISLLSFALLIASGASAQSSLKLTGPVGHRQLSELTTAHPDLQTLDMSEAVIEGNLIPEAAFAGSALKSVVFPQKGEITIGDAAFMGTHISRLYLPASIKHIGSAAFAACEELTEVEIHCATSAGYAFQLCKSLARVNLGTSPAIGPHDYEDCTALTDVKVSESLESIGDYSFSGCTALKEFPFMPKLKTLGDHSFAHSGLVTVDMGKCASLKEIGAWAFASDQSLTKIIFPADAALGEGVLFDCAALRKIVLPANLTAIPDYAFSGSKGSDNYYTVPDGVEYIGAFAYKDSDLGHIVLPAALTEIGSYAMEDTPSLSIIDAGKLSSVPELGTDVWKGVKKEAVSLQVPEDLKEDFKAALQWQDFKIELSGKAEDAIAGTSVRCAMDADRIIIESTGSEIKRVEIYNESGLCFLNSETSGQLIVIPVEDMGLNLFIIRCTLENGAIATAKLTR